MTLNLANAPVPAVGLLWRTVPEGDPDALSLDLLATILGGDALGTLSGAANSSRLYRRLVVEQNLAVVATGMRYGLGHAGLFGAGAALPPLGGDPARTLAALRSELVRLRENGVTSEELNKARNQATQHLLAEIQTVEGRATLIGHAAVVGSSLDELQSRLLRLRSLTCADLQHAAQRHLAPEHALAVTVPGFSLWGQLSRLFLGAPRTEETAPVAFAPETLLRGRDGVTRPPQLPLRPPISHRNPPTPRPPVHDNRLENGLRVLVVPNSCSRLVHAVLALPFGSWAEEKPGAAAMALTLLTKATAVHDDKAFTEELDRLGIELSGVASHDDSRVQLTCLPEYADHAFSLLAEAVTSPAFPEGSLRTAITHALAELRLTDSAQVQVVEREFTRHLFPNHPYGRRHSGESADLLALRPDDLRAFWHRAARPDSSTLILCGGLTEKHAMALARRFFGSWQSPKPVASPALNSPPPAPPPVSAPASTRIFLVDWPGASQSQICLGGLSITNRDPDKPIASLCGSYFGGSFGSRLMKAIRVEKGATYGVAGGFDPDRFAGSFRIRTFTKTASTTDTLRTALAEIRALVAQPPSPEELALHQRFFIGGAAARFETPSQIAAQLAHNALNGLPADYLQRSLNRIASANAAQCAAFTRRAVDLDHLLIVVVGDASAIARDLESIAPVTLLDRQGKEVKTPERAPEANRLLSPP